MAISRLEQALQDRIRAAAPRFTLPALLDLLQRMGYGAGEIEFRSHGSMSHRPALVQDVEFLRGEDDERRAVILVNLGLLGAQGPLPSYFQDLVGKNPEGGLQEFLSFFDHQIIRGRVLSLYPERDPGLFPQWERNKRNLLSLLGLKSPSTLHWLFSRVFPELGVSVRRSVQRQQLQTEGVVVGEAIIGHGCALGGMASVPVGGIDVTLSGEEPATGGGSWIDEVRRRMQGQVTPLLRGSGLFLSLVLALRERATEAQLVRDRFLGFEPLGSSEKPAAPAPGGVPPGPEDFDSGWVMEELDIEPEVEIDVSDLAPVTGPAAADRGEEDEPLRRVLVFHGEA